MKKLLSLVIVILFGALLARTCLYTVNEREYALVFMLGELKSVVSTGSACQTAVTASAAPLERSSLATRLRSASMRR